MPENTKKISLSVIVPCYNVEPYLDRSLTSLEHQWNGRADYEIIFVNDASTDNTLEKLNEFKLRFPNNVFVIDKEKNEGVAEARNAGLEVARGEWVAFFDPDDALVYNGYSQLMRLIGLNDIDILSFGVFSVVDKDWSDDLIRTDLDNMKIDWTGSGQDYVLNGFSGICTSSLYKRKILENRRFPVLTLSEDVIFTLPIFLNEVTVMLTSTNVYCYIQRYSSATNLIDAQKLSQGCDDLVKVIGEMENLMNGLDEPLQHHLKNRQSFYAINLLSRLLLCNKSVDEVKKIRQDLEKVSVLPFKNTNTKMKLRNFVFYNLWLFPIIRKLYRFIRQKNTYA